MITFKHFFENYEITSNSERITVTYRSQMGGDDKVETYTGYNAREQAKNFIDHWVGLDGEIAHNLNYIVANDGGGIVAVKGISISELLGREVPTGEPEEGYAKNIGRTALMLFSPLIYRVPKDKYGRFFWHSDDYSIPKPKTEDDAFDFDLERGWKKGRDWMFSWICSFDQYEGTITASVNINYNSNRPKQVFHNHKTFKPTNRDNDLNIAESVLESIPKDLLEFVENAILDKSKNLK